MPLLESVLIVVRHSFFSRGKALVAHGSWLVAVALLLFEENGSGIVG